MQKFEYKDTISTTYHSEFRKTLSMKKAEGSVSLFFKKRPRTLVGNTKRRPCVQARLNKLRKYLSRAWNGYKFGKLPRGSHRC